jgi:hypothetical protein
MRRTDRARAVARRSARSALYRLSAGLRAEHRVMIDYSMLGALSGLIVAINGLTLWAVKRLLDTQRDALREQTAALSQRDAGFDYEIEAVRGELKDFRIEVSRSYIARDDWIIYVGRMEQKIDAIWGYIFQLTKEQNDGSGPS